MWLPSAFYKYRDDFQRFGSHKGCRYINDGHVIQIANTPTNIHKTSVVGGQGGAGDSGTPRAGPASGIQGVRCLSGTIANSPVGYSPHEFARRPEAGPARGKFWRSQNRARQSPIHLD
ncbi:hypothetical protein [Paralcaligenes ureilyticus]|uniref:hypothetical protein n=1 Tax=Paralcaligenes ureilyticus TaxID=627131 RepID=UPI00104718BC|nr:hypothetical protein [Paralcaligenes ureilyticus]